MPPAHSLSRHRRKGEITAERILDAAEALFAEHGYEGTTLRDVAATVGLRNPSLYNHFASKEALYAAVLERGIRPVLEMLSAYVEQAESADAGELLTQVMALLDQRPNLARLVQFETLAGGQRLSPLLSEWIVPVFAKSTQAAQGRGGWRPDQLPLLVLAMYNVVVGYFSAASLLSELSGDDLLSRNALERQTRFLLEFVERVFTEPPDPAPHG